MADIVGKPISRRRALGLVGAAAAGAIAGPLARAAQPEMLAIQRLAWAGIRLQLPRGTLFIDPLTNDQVWGGALADRLVPVDDATGDRFVLITHRHPDHADPKAIREALGEGGTLVHAGAGAPHVAGVRLRAAAPYEPQILGDFTATAVPASDGYGDPQHSWVVSGGGRRIIHCGDTLWHGHWWQIGRQFGPFDAAFLPVNGARFHWRQPASEIPAVLTPEQAVAAAIILGARTLVPIHYGVSGADGYQEIEQPIGALRTAAERRGIDLSVLAPGDWLRW
jgi:L-ascorbate metabolism protein UlaG (beta-lactamase superfamily)